MTELKTITAAELQTMKFRGKRLPPWSLDEIDKAIELLDHTIASFQAALDYIDGKIHASQLDKWLKAIRRTEDLRIYLEDRKHDTETMLRLHGRNTSVTSVTSSSSVTGDRKSPPKPPT